LKVSLEFLHARDGEVLKAEALEVEYSEVVGVTVNGVLRVPIGLLDWEEDHFKVFCNRSLLIQLENGVTRQRIRRQGDRRCYDDIVEAVVSAVLLIFRGILLVAVS